MDEEILSHTYYALLYNNVIYNFNFTSYILSSLSVCLSMPLYYPSAQCHFKNENKININSRRQDPRRNDFCTNRCNAALPSLLVAGWLECFVQEVRHCASFDFHS